MEQWMTEVRDAVINRGSLETSTNREWVMRPGSRDRRHHEVPLPLGVRSYATLPCTWVKHRMVELGQQSTNVSALRARWAGDHYPRVNTKGWASLRLDTGAVSVGHSVHPRPLLWPTTQRVLVEKESGGPFSSPRPL